MENSLTITEDSIKNKIHTIRGLQVMLDNDLASLYAIETKALNRAVKRNIERFPEDFMFQLTKNEYENLKYQNGTSSYEWGGKRKYSYAFTQEGVATLSGILRSKIAIEMNIQIMRAFISMRRFILSNAQIFQKIYSVERKQIEYQINTDKKLEIIFDVIERKEIKPEKGIFFDGQIFDAYKFVSSIIKSAKISIILIDNYIDESVLTLFSEREKSIEVVIYTKIITKKLKLDLEKYNSQYPNISIKEFKHSHDRFMIIDNSIVYHIGASLKDMGKKWFAFSRFDKETFGIIERLE